MTVEINVTETSYGFLSLEVSDDATESEICEKAREAYENGNVVWNGGDFRVTKWEKA